MSIAELIRNRRHIKQFSDKPVAEADIISWFHEAAWAPNHRMTEPWQINFVGPETRAQIHHGADFGDAPVVIAILSKRAERPADRDENLIATACFVQNFSLLAWEAGVGVRWTSIGWTEPAREALDVSDDYDVLSILGIGYPAEIPQPRPRTPIDAKVQRLP